MGEANDGTADVLDTPFLRLVDTYIRLMEEAQPALRRVKDGVAANRADPLGLGADTLAVRRLADFQTKVNAVVEMLLFNVQRDTPHVLDALAEVIVTKYFEVTGSSLNELRALAKQAREDRDAFRRETEQFRAEMDKVRRQQEAVMYEQERASGKPPPPPKLKLHGDGIEL